MSRKKTCTTLELEYICLNGIHRRGFAALLAVWCRTVHAYLQVDSLTGFQQFMHNTHHGEHNRFHATHQVWPTPRAPTQTGNDTIIPGSATRCCHDAYPPRPRCCYDVMNSCYPNPSINKEGWSERAGYLSTVPSSRRARQYAQQLYTLRLLRASEPR